MTAKEKAEELVNKYAELQEQNYDWFPSKTLAKQGALIAVDEIISTNPKIEIEHRKNNCIWYDDQSNIDFWGQVKIEIEKL